MTVSPTLSRPDASFHGSALSCLIPRDTRARARSTLRTLASTTSPTLTASDGWLIFFHDRSCRWMSPSTPPRSTNAPKSVMVLTVPLTVWPSSRLWRMFSWETANLVMSSLLPTHHWADKSASITRHSILNFRYSDN